MSMNSVLQMYLGWANSLLCEDSLHIEGLHALLDGRVFCILIRLLTGDVLVENKLDQKVTAAERLQCILDYLHSQGIKITANPVSVANGERKSILDIMWVLILHFTIHSSETTSLRRTVREGKRALIHWCAAEMPGQLVNQQSNSLVSVFQGNTLLADLIAKYCPYEEPARDVKGRDAISLKRALSAAETRFGLVASLLRAEEVVGGSADEHALVVYLALLRRKTGGSSKLADGGEKSGMTGALQLMLRHQAKSQAAIKTLQEQLNSFKAIRQENQRRWNVEMDQAAGVTNSNNATIGKGGEASQGTEQTGLEADGDDLDATLELEGDHPLGAILKGLASPTTSSGGDDELLTLLEAIGQECSMLRRELAQAQHREGLLFDELQRKSEAEATAAAATTTADLAAAAATASSDSVVIKLVEELEILRAENKKLFQEVGFLRGGGPGKTFDLDGLQQEVGALRMENADLKQSLDRSEVGRGVNGDPRQELEAARRENQYLQGKLRESNRETVHRLEQLGADLKKAQEENRQLERENQSLKLDLNQMDTLQGKCQRLQRMLAESESNNRSLGEQLNDSEARTSPRTSPRSKVSLQRENFVLRERLGMFEEERLTLREELKEVKTFLGRLDNLTQSQGGGGRLESSLSQSQLPSHASSSNTSLVAALPPLGSPGSSHSSHPPRPLPSSPLLGRRDRAGTGSSSTSDLQPYDPESYHQSLRSNYAKHQMPDKPLGLRELEAAGHSLGSRSQSGSSGESRQGRGQSGSSGESRQGRFQSGSSGESRQGRVQRGNDQSVSAPLCFGQLPQSPGEEVDHYQEADSVIDKYLEPRSQSHHRHRAWGTDRDERSALADTSAVDPPQRRMADAVTDPSQRPMPMPSRVLNDSHDNAKGSLLPPSQNGSTPGMASQLSGSVDNSQQQPLSAGVGGVQNNSGSPLLSGSDRMGGGDRGSGSLLGSGKYYMHDYNLSPEQQDYANSLIDKYLLMN